MKGCGGILEPFVARNEVQLDVIDVTSDEVVELSDRSWNVELSVFDANEAVVRTPPGLELLFGSPNCEPGG